MLSRRRLLIATGALGALAACAAPTAAPKPAALDQPVQPSIAPVAAAPLAVAASAQATFVDFYAEW